MQILAHRGFWQHPDERNSRAALNTAFRHGLGIETDIRDLNGKLVISHDMPRTGALQLDIMLDDYLKAEQPGCLALNIKADGLASTLKQMLCERNITHYFCFDMSVPDTLAYLQEDMPVAARLSEYESPGMLTDMAPFIWMDQFHPADLPANTLQHWLSAGKQVCLVSPELHGRAPESLWAALAEMPESVRRHPGLMLCTDFPERAGRTLA
ncbi:hypothetical protein HWQ18_10850 [Enterobacter ludwigii]|uniref:hypothetical protein n=1 Tax=Enterobacter ludwigii TaxID=299767 RepID=UPI00159C7D01|nr:hypothetical protein [Enterobacter ludwigii]QLA06954.1 hypothetical protein HWQ18_10850 [Enterobacter ludwigii]